MPAPVRTSKLSIAERQSLGVGGLGNYPNPLKKSAVVCITVVFVALSRATSVRAGIKIGKQSPGVSDSPDSIAYYAGLAVTRMHRQAASERRGIYSIHSLVHLQGIEAIEALGTACSLCFSPTKANGTRMRAVGD